MKKYMRLLGVAVLASFLFASCDQEKKADTDTASLSTNTPTATASLESVVAEVTKDVPTGPLGKFEFKEELFDFGPIKQGDQVEHTFKFTNTGEGPLVIADIKASCGCTTPSWPKEPVAPGEEAEILVKFNSAGKAGLQNKNITITANVASGRKVITIKTNVEVDNTAAMMGPLKKEKK